MQSIDQALLLLKEHPSRPAFLDMMRELLEGDRKKSLFLTALEDKKRHRVRGAACVTLGNLLNAFEPEKQLDEKVLENYARCILNMLDEKERVVQKGLWSGCVLTLLQKCSTKMILKCDLKSVELKCLENLKRCAGGIGANFYKAQMTFLSLIPLSHINPAETKEEQLREKLDFLRRFLDSMLQGFAHDEIKSFSEDLTVAYFECLYFI